MTISGALRSFSEPSANGQGTYTAVINRLENPIVAVQFDHGHPAQNDPVRPVTMKRCASHCISK